MDSVSYLFFLVPENRIHTLLQIALDQVADESMQFYSGMIRTGQASSSRQQVGMPKYRPYSCTKTSAATLLAPNTECLL